MITAPAAFSRSIVSASAVGRQSRHFGYPQVVAKPAILNCSLTVIGIPSNGRPAALPPPSSRSAAAAASRARSKSRTTTALIFGSSASMRAIAASHSSRADTLRAESCDFRSPAVW
jgi:hypothetical protein